MPRFVNWLLGLLVLNPICLRLVGGGSKRSRHLLLRSGYLAVMIIVLLTLLVQAGSGQTLQELAAAGATSFAVVAYIQLTLICLLAPVFMAGAIAQEANPRTWDILLTTPLTSLQIVLGNLFGRLFFVVALLFSSLPLFAVTQLFGGVPSESIFVSYAIAAVTALVVGVIAITLSCTRQAGRRAVFLFYIGVVSYIALTWSLDLILRQQNPMGVGRTTWATPLNPFLAQNVLFGAENYREWGSTELVGEGWFTRLWLGSPILAYCLLGSSLSLALIVYSTLGLRLIGARVSGRAPWYRRLLKLRSASGAGQRSARTVWKNPIAWREAAARRSSLMNLVGMWSFIGIGVLAGLSVVLGLHFDRISLQLSQQAILALVTTEIAVIALTALNVSATAISREREDGTLDLLLTTPLTPTYYLSGKLRGIIAFILPMLAVPVATLGFASLYVLSGAMGRGPQYWGFLYDSTAVSPILPITGPNLPPGATVVPFVLPESVLALPLVLLPFIALCVIIGLNWSLKSKGTIRSVVSAVGIVLVIASVISLCAQQAGSEVPVIGAFLTGFSPANVTFASVIPATMIRASLQAGDIASARVGLVFGAGAAGLVYGLIVVGVFRAMLGPNGKSFDMTVRRLAGTT